MTSLALAVLLLGCSEEPPPTLGGAGVRVVLPAGADSVQWIQVELWHDNPVPPVLCSLLDTNPAPHRPLAEGGGCTRRTVEIRDLLGETVRHLDESPSPNRTWAWDQRDEEGSLVPGGIYPTWQFCEEGTGADFTGHYYTGPREPGHEDQWILWSRRIEPVPSGGRLEFFPFPEAFWILWFVDDEIGGCAEVTPQFSSPFILRVRIPGWTAFEGPVSLTDEVFTEVTVTFPPGTGMVP